MQNKQRVTIATLIIAIIGLSIGFAAFSNNLTIRSSANVNPDPTSLNVVFSKSNNSSVSGEVNPDNSTYGSNAIIDANDQKILRDIKATFTQPGQSVTYELYVYNAGRMAAYLDSLTMGTKTCEASTTKIVNGETVNLTEEEMATPALVSQACGGINVEVTIGNVTKNYSGSLNNQLISRESALNAKVKITYENGAAYVDGPMTVTFGDITFTAVSNSNSIVDGGNSEEEVCETVVNKSFGSTCTYTDLDSSSSITKGDKVTCGTESFYVIENPSSSTVKMLAEWNLNVTDPDAEVYQGISESQLYTCSTEGYQDEHVRGLVDEDNPNNLPYMKQVTFYGSGSGSGSGSYGSYTSGGGSYYGSGSGGGNRIYYLPYGTVAFWSETAMNNYNYNYHGYWTNNSYDSLNSNFSECTEANCYEYNVIQYPVDVYGISNSNNGATATLTSHVTNYVQYLNNAIDGANAQGRLITYEEIEALGCSMNDYTCSDSPATAPSWVYQTSYWFGSAHHDNYVWIVRSNGQFYGDNFYGDSSYGVRPVIEISKDAIN